MHDISAEREQQQAKHESTDMSARVDRTCNRPRNLIVVGPSVQKKLALPAKGSHPGSSSALYDTFHISHGVNHKGWHKGTCDHAGQTNRQDLALHLRCKLIQLAATIMGVFNTALQAVGLQRPPPELSIAALWVYPIKGCRGCKVTSALVETIGFPLDRYWMIVTEVEGRFVTQRQESKLALIATKLPQSVWLEGSEKASNADAALTMQAPGMPDIKVRLYKIQQYVSSIRFSITLS